MAHRSTPRGRHPAVARLYPVLALALLAAMLIWPSANVRGGTAGLPTDGEAALFQATPDAQQDAQPAAQPETGGARLLPEDQSGIYLNKLECQGSFGGDLEAMLQNCPVMYNVNFEIFGPNLQLTANGGIALERLPAGQYRIREFVPAGYGDPTAFCGVGPTNGPLPTFTQVIVYDGYYEFELGPSQSIYCNWFNIVPQAAADTATLYINKHFCPAASEFDAYSASIYDLAANCHEPSMPVPFEVTLNGTRIGGGTASGAPDALVLTGLPAGSITITEELPEGFGDPLVFCTVKDELGGARAPLAQAQTDNNRAFWQLNAGDVVFCDWFNVPAPRGTSISVVKFICPAGALLQSYEDFAAACTETRADVSFKLDGARTGNPGDQLTDANGQITWAEMEADRYFLTEEVPDGFGPPVAFCSYYLPAALQIRVYEPYPVSSENRIEFEVADGQFIACSWFNRLVTADTAPLGTPDSTGDPAGSPEAAATTTVTPAQTAAGGAPSSTTPATGGQTTSTTSVTPAAVDPSTPATLIIRAFRCEPGYPYLAVDAEPEIDCPEQADDLAFELSSFTSLTEAQSRRRANLGGVDSTFSGVDPGRYRLVAVNAPPDATAFIHGCQSDRRNFNDYVFSPFAIVAGDGSVRLSLVPGETITCDWYDVPTGPDA